MIHKSNPEKKSNWEKKKKTIKTIFSLTKQLW